MRLCRVSLAALLLCAGCVRAGFDSDGSSSSDVTRPSPADALGDHAADARTDRLAQPGTKVFGGTTDPAWTGTVLASVSPAGGVVRLEEQPGFRTKLATLPAPGAWGAAATFKDEIVIFGGGTKVSTFQSTDAVLSYLPATDKLSVVAKLPAPRLGAQAVTALDGKIYLVMGIDPTISKVIESQALRFDPVLRTVNTAVSDLYAAYHHGSALGPNGVIYSFAGYGSGPLHDTIEGFDPKTGKVVPVSKSLASFGAREKLAAFAAPNGAIYLFGGALLHDEASHLGGKVSDQILRFDVATSAVAALSARLPVPMFNLAGGLLPDGMIYLVGGDTPSAAPPGAAPSSAMLRFDPKTESLTKLSETLPQPLSGAAAAVGENGKLYLFGGFTAGGLSDKVLELHPYSPEGAVLSPVIDTGAAQTICLELAWSSKLPPGTALEMAIRAGDAPFPVASPSPAWQLLEGPPPATTGLPRGRYLQWRAALKTVNSAISPTLGEVSVRYQTP